MRRSHSTQDQNRLSISLSNDAVRALEGQTDLTQRILRTWIDSVAELASKYPKTSEARSYSRTAVLTSESKNLLITYRLNPNEQTMVVENIRVHTPEPF